MRGEEREGEREGEKAMATDESCALVVVVDVSVSLWSKSIAPGGGGGGGGEAVAGKNEKNFKVSDFVEHLHAFLNAYLLVHARNRVGVVAISDSKSHLIRLPSLGGRDLCSSDASRSSGSGRNKRESVLDDLKNGLEQVYQKDYVKEVGDQGAENENGREGEGEGEEKHDGVALSAAYSRALCLLKRHQESVSGSVSGGGGYEAHQAGHEEGNNADEARQCQRLLFLSGSKDVPAQYIQVMNASFCAQKMNVIVDTFMLGGVDSSFLQQAGKATFFLFFGNEICLTSAWIHHDHHH